MKKEVVVEERHVTKSGSMRKIMLVCAILSCCCVNDAWGWGNKEKREAKKQAKMEAKAEARKTGIKNWQMTRYRYLDVKSAISAKGKLETEDLAFVCNIEEVQPLADAILAAYVTVVNILDRYAEVEEGNAIAGLVAEKVAGGKAMSEAVGELSVADRESFERYLQWLKNGENAGMISIEEEDLDKILVVVTSFKEQIGEIKARVKGRKGAKVALAKDMITLVKVAGSAAKGGLMLKGIVDREKQAKKLLLAK